MSITRALKKITHLFGAALICATFAPALSAFARDDSALISKTDRKAILNELRAAGQDQTRVFVVKYLAVENDWAWIRVDPQSKDNANHYETETHLLHKAGGLWQNIDAACGEDGCDYGAEVSRIQLNNPEAPSDIFDAEVLKY